MSSQNLRPIIILEAELTSIKNPGKSSQYGRLSRPIHPRQDVRPKMGSSLAI